MNKDSIITVRVDKAVKKKFIREAKRRGRTLSEEVRNFLYLVYGNK